jgi:hypothetical protein
LAFGVEQSFVLTRFQRLSTGRRKMRMFERRGCAIFSGSMVHPLHFGGSVRRVGPGEECPAAQGPNAMAGLPDAVTQSQPSAGQAGGRGEARSLSPSCSWHSWRKTMKEIESYV